MPASISFIRTLGAQRSNPCALPITSASMFSPFPVCTCLRLAGNGDITVQDFNHYDKFHKIGLVCRNASRASAEIVVVPNSHTDFTIRSDDWRMSYWRFQPVSVCDQVLLSIRLSAWEELIMSWEFFAKGEAGCVDVHKGVVLVLEQKTRGCLGMLLAVSWCFAKAIHCIRHPGITCLSRGDPASAFGSIRLCHDQYCLRMKGGWCMFRRCCFQKWFHNVRRCLGSEFTTWLFRICRNSKDYSLLKNANQNCSSR